MHKRRRIFRGSAPYLYTSSIIITLARRCEMILGNTYSLQYEFYGPTYINEGLLNEGITDGLLKDGIQFLVAGAAEYGLGAITLPVAGSGLAVGPTVETLVDSMFAAEEIKSAIETISSLQSTFGEYQNIIQDAIDAYDMDNLEGYYDSLVTVVQTGFKDLVPEDMADKFEEKIKKFKETLEGIINKLMGPIKSGLKLVIPDATLSLAVAKFVQELLQNLAENAFSAFASGISNFTMFKDFLADPSSAIDFFKDVFRQLESLLGEAADKIEDASWTKSMLAFGPGGALIVKKLGPSGMRKISELLASSAPTVIEIIDKVLNVVIPMMITCLALFQIVMKQDYVTEMDEEELEDTLEDSSTLAAGNFSRKNQNMISEKSLRHEIRRRIIVQSRYTQ